MPELDDPDPKDIEQAADEYVLRRQEASVDEAGGSKPQKMRMRYAGEVIELRSRGMTYTEIEEWMLENRGIERSQQTYKRWHRWALKQYCEQLLEKSGILLAEEDRRLIQMIREQTQMLFQLKQNLFDDDGNLTTGNATMVQQFNRAVESIRELSESRRKLLNLGAAGEKVAGAPEDDEDDEEDTIEITEPNQTANQAGGNE